MDKQKEENVKVYMRSVMRLGKFFNNYKVYFVYLQDLPKKEIEFSHTLLPDDYPVKIPLNPT